MEQPNSFIVVSRNRFNPVEVEVPYNVEELILESMGLEEIPPQLIRCMRLQKLFISKHCLARLEHLPSNLRELYITRPYDIFNEERCPKIKRLENLPPKLRVLHLQRTKIRIIENLPNRLQELDLSDSDVSHIQGLPASLRSLDLSWSNIDMLENIPEGLQYLNISHTSVHSLQGLPGSLKDLNASNCSVHTIPTELPVGLQHLSLRHNQVEALVQLPVSLQVLDVGMNPIRRLEGLPEGLRVLTMDRTLVERDSLRHLPPQLQELEASDTPLTESFKDNLPEDDELPPFLEYFSSGFFKEDHPLFEEIDSGRRADRKRAEFFPRIVLDFLSCSISPA